MTSRQQVISPESFQTIGDLLRYLRKRAGLTQRELAAQVGYHYAHLNRIENNQRLPNEATLLAQFVPALSLEDQSKWVQRMLQLRKEAESVQLPPQEQVSSQLIERHYVPSLPIALLGREQEFAQLSRLLLQPETKLVTLVGPPGVGKTSLALHTAGKIEHHFTHGAVFVDLALITSADLVLSAIASALGIHGAQAGQELKSLQAHLHNQTLLIILDNFEQVIDAAPLLMKILTSAPAVKMLCTSREALRLNGEWEFLLNPLTVPDKENQSVILEFPSVQLFLQRAVAVHPSFQITDENASFVAEICRRLDGLPLAIELAAARSRSLSPRLMIEQFDRRFDWMTQAGRASFWRQTLRGAIEWSYALLDGTERALFCRLSVFNGSWSLADAEEICADELLCLPADVLRISLQLVDKSLLVLDPISGRYHFLETIRECAKENFQKISDFDEYISRHAQYFSRRLLNTTPKVIGPDWLNQVDVDQSNIHASLNYFREANCFSEIAETVLVMNKFWEKRAHFTEAQHWLEVAVAMNDKPTLLRARLLQNLGSSYRVLGKYQLAEEVSEASRALHESLGNEAGVYFALDSLAILAGIRGDYAKTIELLEKVVTYRRNSGDNSTITISLNNLSIAYRRTGNLQRAKELYTEVTEITEKAGNLVSLGHALYGLSEVYKDMKDYKVALDLATRSALVRYELGDKRGVAFSLSAIAMLKHHLGMIAEAVQLESAARNIREGIKAAASPLAQAEIELFHAQLQEAMGEKEYKKNWKKGNNLSIDQAVALLET